MNACLGISSCIGLIPRESVWKDERELFLNTEKELEIRGTVTHKPSEDIYGTFVRDSDREIVSKMFTLLFVTPLYLAPRMICRLGYLLSCHWAWEQGYKEALLSWRIERFNCAIEGQTPPDRIDLYTKVAICSLHRFTEALVKLLTLPIGMSFMTLSTLVSILDPLLARRWYAEIEEAWSLDLQILAGKYLRHFSILINYAAICMQPFRVFEGKNFYAFFDHYDPQSICSLTFSLQRQVEEKKDYFTPEEHENIILKIQTYKENRPISNSQEYEAMKEATNTLTLQLIQKEREYLKQTIQALHNYINTCDLFPNTGTLERPSSKNFMKKIKKLSDA